MYNINDRVTFGQYKGLKIQEIFQGTLNINRGLVASYLEEILNNEPEYPIGFEELELIERFDIDTQRIKIIGQIFNESKPLTESNRVVFGNLEKEISSYINCHWKDNNLGILTNIKKYAKENKTISPLGGDPEYLRWCEKNQSDFQLDKNTKSYLEKLTVCRFKGIDVVFKGMNEYEYREVIEFEEFKFNK